MKIVITDADTVSTGDLSFDFLNAYGSVEKFGLTLESEVADRIKDADIVLCNKTPMTKSALSDAKNLKYIGLFATGFNNIDLDYCRERGITVSNAPAYSTDAVAQIVFAYILHFANRINDYAGLVAKGSWINSPTFSFFPLPLAELCGKTIGIVGYGSIGRRVASIANAFKMNVIVYTRTRRDNDGVTFVSLDELFRKSDFITLHCPLNDGTRKLVNGKTLSYVKKGAILINTSRGGVVDEAALSEALISGKLGGAAVDVLESEPMSESCRLRGIENCIITPHIAWAGLETRKRLLTIVDNNLKCFMEGNPINNVAN